MFIFLLFWFTVCSGKIVFFPQTGGKNWTILCSQNQSYWPQQPLCKGQWWCWNSTSIHSDENAKIAPVSSTRISMAWPFCFPQSGTDLNATCEKEKCIDQCPFLTNFSYSDEVWCNEKKVKAVSSKLPIGWLPWQDTPNIDIDNPIVIVPERSLFYFRKFEDAIAIQKGDTLCIVDNIPTSSPCPVLIGDCCYKYHKSVKCIETANMPEGSRGIVVKQTLLKLSFSQPWRNRDTAINYCLQLLYMKMDLIEACVNFFSRKHYFNTIPCAQKIEGRNFTVYFKVEKGGIFSPFFIALAAGYMGMCTWGSYLIVSDLVK